MLFSRRLQIALVAPLIVYVLVAASLAVLSNIHPGWPNPHRDNIYFFIVLIGLMTLAGLVEIFAAPMAIAFLVRNREARNLKHLAIVALASYLALSSLVGGLYYLLAMSGREHS
jgi:hypothetical protein